MSQVLIENYRGWDISFDVNSETFIAYSNIYDEEQKEKKSFAAAKKYVDDFIKANETFKPFCAVSNGGFYALGDKINIIGIRKDRRFVYYKEGKLTQISDYSEDSYVIYEEWMEEIFKKYIEIEEQIEHLSKTQHALIDQEFKPKAKSLTNYKKETFL